MDKQQEEFINAYAEGLITEMGIDNNIPKEIREEMKIDLLDRLNNFIISKVVDALPEEKIKELNNIIGRKTEGEVWGYIKKNIKNFDTFSLEILNEFRNLYLGRK